MHFEHFPPNSYHWCIVGNTRTIEHEMLSQTNDQNVNVNLRLPQNISQTIDCYSAKKKLRLRHFHFSHDRTARVDTDGQKFRANITK